MVKKKDLKGMGKEELEKQLDDLRMELMKANSQIASGSAKNPGQVKQIKKNIARMIMLLNKNKTKEEGKKDE